jgi:hypothetical protein
VGSKRKRVLALGWTRRGGRTKPFDMADRRQGIPATGDDTARARPDAPTRDAPTRDAPTRDAPTRDARLKAALKANLARRKAQGRALAPGAERGAGATAPDVARNPAEPDAATSHSTPDTSDARAPDLEKD